MTEKTTLFTEKTTERLVSAALLILVGGGGGAAYFAKPTVTVEEVVQGIKDEATSVHHDIEMEQMKQDNEIDKVKIRSVQWDRYQVESTEQMKKTQDDILMLQQQTIEIMEEIKE